MPIKNIFKTYKMPMRGLAQRRSLSTYDGCIVRDPVEIMREKELTLHGQLAIIKLKDLKPLSKLDEN